MVKTLAAAVAAVTLAGCFPKEVELARDGVAKAEIVLGEKATTVSQFAAAELKAHLDAVTGGDFAVVRGRRTPGLNAIYVGPESLPPELADKVDVASLGEQEHAIAFAEGAVILVGRDASSTNAPRVSYSGTRTLETRTWCCNWPNIWTTRGTLNAAYDFLRDFCGVEWLDPYESGTLLPRRPDLAAKGTVVRSAAFVRCRDASGFNCGRGSDGCLWSRKLHPEAWTNFYRAAFPETFARPKCKPFDAIMMQEYLFVLRMKLGGEHVSANHSFYWWYDRFLDRKNPNFIAYHPEYFSKHRLRRTAGQGEDGSFGAFDTARRPSQLCYSNPEVVRQAVVDVRAYFDAGGYTNRYTNQGTPCDAKHPTPQWGRNVCCLEPMDNGSFCECDACARQYDPSRRADHASQSDYWFAFVNKVAREIKKSHPGKYVSTLAYGSGREGLPTFPLEDNVVVHFCWDANRGPNRLPHKHVQEELMRKWRAAYPKNEFGLWLYNTFPYELMHANERCNSFPGFFGRMLTDEYRLIRDLNMRECIFNCGWEDEFENYLSARYMWNPSEDYGRLKDTFFSAYGPAEKPIRAFYDLVEQRYCNPSNFVDSTGKFHNGHMTRKIAWGCLGTPEVMDELGGLMTAAEEAVRANGTAQQRARVELWRKGVWDYMLAGCQRMRKLPIGTDKVKVTRTDYLARLPKPLAGDVLRGKPLFSIVRKDGVETEVGKPGKNTFTQFTDGNYRTRNIQLPNAKGTEVLHVTKTPVKGLSRFRVELQMGDGLRYRARFRPVGLVGGKWIDLGPEVNHDEYCGGFSFPGTDSVTVYEYAFAPGSVPALEGLGFVNVCPGWGYPGYCLIEAE